MNLVPLFFMVNEEGETYGFALRTIDEALKVLYIFPNDHIEVRLLTPEDADRVVEENARKSVSTIASYLDRLRGQN